MRDSIRAALAEAAQMQDTSLQLERSFVVRNIYAAVGPAGCHPGFNCTTRRSCRIRSSPGSALYCPGSVSLKDSMDIIRDSLNAVNIALTAIADSVTADSVRRHWAGWKKYEVQPRHSYTMNSEKCIERKEQD